MRAAKWRHRELSATEVVMLADTRTNAVARPAAASSRFLAVFFAALLGAFLLYGVGFAQSNLLHNAAHDSRHASGFPCH